MPQASVTLSDFPLYSRWEVSGGRITSGPSLVQETKTFTVSGVPEGSTVQSAVFTGTMGSPFTGVDLFTINRIAKGLGEQSVSLTPASTGNGDYVVVFAFRAKGSASMSDGAHGGTVMVGSPTVTVTYTLSEEEEEEAAIELDTEKNICLFPPKATSFDNNGIAVLSPFSCIISETAGGEYSLSMEHPMDTAGKWMLILEESIIRSPIPEKVTPKITLPPAALWRVTAEKGATLYSVLPTYTKAKTQIDRILDSPNSFSWSSGKNYAAGDYCVYGNGIYQAIRANSGREPGTSTGYWAYVCSISDTGGGSSSSEYIYNPGVVAETLKTGEMISFVADYNSSYIRVRSLRGVVGYVRRADVTKMEDESGGTVIPPRHIRNQLFRVQSVAGNAETRTISIYATHISYDYGANKLYDCQLTDAPPATALAIMQGSTVNPDTRLIACPITAPAITADWSWSSPISALLDPDDGIVPVLRAQLIRDNADFFVLPNKNPPQGLTLRYGGNLLGVTWERAMDDVVTRVLPRGEQKNGAALLLPEIFVDSDNFDGFALPYTEVLDVNCKIGAEISKADGTKQTLTAEDCYQMMREAAQKRFDVDKADAVSVRLEVNVLLLGDTAEYAQYKNLQWLHLYDAVRIEHGPAGLSAFAQVAGYSWDAVTKRYQSISLGDIFSFGGRTVAGYDLASGSVTYNKLSPGAIKKIRSAQ